MQDYYHLGNLLNQTVRIENVGEPTHTTLHCGRNGNDYCIMLENGYALCCGYPFGYDYEGNLLKYKKSNIHKDFRKFISK